MKPNDERIKKGEKTRTNILEAAVFIIAENGLKEVSTAKLAQVAGISKSTIFHHFRSSDEVLTCTLAFVYEKLLQTMVVKENYSDAEHFFDVLGQSMFQGTRDHLTYFKAFSSFSHESLFNSNYRTIMASYADQMNRFFRTQLSKLASTSVPSETIEAVSSMLLPLMDGIGFHYLLTNDSGKYEQIWAMQKRVMLQMLDQSKK